MLCWDLGKYVNHCCHSNTISTAYGCDLAFRDIQPGEELTSEYALFTFDREMELLCHYPDCRKRLNAAGFRALLAPLGRERSGGDRQAA